MVVAVRVRDLVAGDAVAPVESVQQAQLEQLVDDAIHGRGRAGALSAEAIRDLLCAHQALTFACEQLDDGGPRRAGPKPGPGRPVLGSFQPAVAQLRVHDPEASDLSGFYDRDPPVIIAVVTVRVMQVAGDEVVDVIAVRDLLVTAVRAVDVLALVGGAVVLRSAVGGMVGVDLDDVLVDVIPVGVMQVPAVEIVDVAVVFDGGVSAARLVLVLVLLVDGVLVHAPSLPQPPRVHQAAESETRSQGRFFRFVLR